MKQNETKKVPKSSENFVCECCDYITSKYSQYERHLLTAKHKNETNETLLKQKSSKKFQCLNCDVIFGSRTTLWRHKQSCHKTEELENRENPIENNDENNKDKDLIMMLVKQNSELLEVIKNGTHNNTTNSHNTISNNKTFNLQFFLNETCKDAMNIMDFVESIKLQLTDLEKVGELGYVEGISNIIIKNLKELDVTQRPVHCTDKKREVLYIKDEDKWEKDEEKNKIRKVIKKVASKNQRLLSKFKEAHPDCSKSSSKYSDQYNKIIVESMGGAGDNDSEKEDKIIRKITTATTIDKE
jgi:hypothetical protein